MALICTGSKTGPSVMGPKSPRRNCQRQLCSWIALSPWAMATPAMDAPLAIESCTTCRLKSTVYRRRSPLITGAREAENSLIKISVHLPKLMDTYFDEASTRALDGTGRTLTAKQGERARNREALVIKAKRRISGGCAVKECVLTWG